VEFDQKYIRKLVAYVRAFHFNQAPTLTANSQPSAVGGTESLPPTAPAGSDLGHKDQTQPEQATPGASGGGAGLQGVPSNPAQSASPSSGSATGTEPITAPAKGTATPQH